MKIVSSLLAGVLLLGATPLHAANVMMDLLDRFNVIAGDYKAGNETEGSAFVYGTYKPTAGRARFGFNDGQVGNDREATLWLNNGVGNGNATTLLSGSVVSRTDVNSGRFTLNGNAPGTPGITTGETAWSNALSSVGLTSVNNLTGMLALASRQWSQLAASSTGSAPGNGSYTINAVSTTIDGHQVAVFNVSGDVLFGQNNGFDRLELNLNGAQTILINVSGTDITIAKNFTNGFTNNEKKILFNFYEATSLTVNRNVRGGIFAPFANVNQVNTNLDGTVVAASLNQTAEIHNERFDGYLPFSTTIPEPTTALLAVAGLAIALRRKR
ncbi:choice-of-anchor A family protein [Luteolibacter arcticus]|uniref:Choice-of-anchor A family protein n=1 Tax=Luteolibacter arcticus TaxID=1581411 RepID=A0ABT3GT10_9BACT|nr:choice-of-anchor A family protein [Luteolibacter arcticus]MCW1926613.1 choice-of-anchor A family protein [Luteolibacter arcticus]